MAAGFSEPTLSPRYGHFSAPVGGQVLLSGGRTRDYHKDKSSLLSTVQCFDLYSETWRERVVDGAPPPGIYYGACASSGQCLYCFGGYDGSNRHNSLLQLDTSSSATPKWTQLTTPDSNSGPMKKAGCGIIVYGSSLVNFGGHGVPCGPTQPGAEFVKDGRYTTGWSNELHVFDVRKGETVLVHITASVEVLLVLHGLVVLNTRTLNELILRLQWSSIPSTSGCFGLTYFYPTCACMV